MNKNLLHTFALTAGASMILLTAGFSCGKSAEEKPAEQKTEEVATAPATEAAPVTAIKTVATKEEFEAAKKEGMVVVKISGATCGACEAMKPLDEEMSKKFADKKVNFVVVDLNNEAVKELNVHGVPTYVFFKDGKEVARFETAVEAKVYEDAIVKAFGL